MTKARYRVPRKSGSNPAGCSTGQAALEALVVTLVLVAGFWGTRWMQGEGGVMAMLLQALRLWHERFAVLLALPV